MAKLNQYPLSTFIAKRLIQIRPDRAPNRNKPRKKRFYVSKKIGAALNWQQ